MIQHSIPFPENQFNIIPIRENPDLSMPAIAKHLRQCNVPEFQDNVAYTSWMLHSISYACVMSAETLVKTMPSDKNLVSNEVIPSLFLCKHAIELKLKHCLLTLGETCINSHNIMDLWTKVVSCHATPLPYIDKLHTFIEEMYNLDNNEMALRYGSHYNLSPLQEDFIANVSSVLNNTKCLFNILHQEVLHTSLPVLY